MLGCHHGWFVVPECPWSVPASQRTATELFQSPLHGSGTVFRSTSHLLRHFTSSALAWRHTSLDSVTRNYCCRRRAREVTLSFMDTLIALTYLYLRRVLDIFWRDRITNMEVRKRTDHWVLTSYRERDKGSWPSDHAQSCVTRAVGCKYSHDCVPPDWRKAPAALLDMFGYCGKGSVVAYSVPGRDSRIWQVMIEHLGGAVSWRY